MATKPTLNSQVLKAAEAIKSTPGPIPAKCTKGDGSLVIRWVFPAQENFPVVTVEVTVPDVESPPDRASKQRGYVKGYQADVSTGTSAFAYFFVPASGIKVIIEDDVIEVRGEGTPLCSFTAADRQGTSPHGLDGALRTMATYVSSAGR